MTLMFGQTGNIGLDSESARAPSRRQATLDGG
jgi:hypothetical protein